MDNQRLTASQRDVFDIAHTLPDSFPPKFAAGYLNQANVQQALGVPLNFTGESLAVSNGRTPFDTISFNIY